MWSIPKSALKVHLILSVVLGLSASSSLPCPDRYQLAPDKKTCVLCPKGKTCVNNVVSGPPFNQERFIPLPGQSFGVVGNNYSEPTFDQAMQACVEDQCRPDHYGRHGNCCYQKSSCCPSHGSCLYLWKNILSEKGIDASRECSCPCCDSCKQKIHKQCLDCQEGSTSTLFCEYLAVNANEDNGNGIFCNDDKDGSCGGRFHCRKACSKGEYMYFNMCLTCPAGAICPHGELIVCPEGSYSLKGQTEACMPCPVGFYCLSGALKPSSLGTETVVQTPYPSYRSTSKSTEAPSISKSAFKEGINDDTVPMKYEQPDDEFVNLKFQVSWIYRAAVIIIAIILAYCLLKMCFRTSSRNSGSRQIARNFHLVQLSPSSDRSRIVRNRV